MIFWRCYLDYDEFLAPLVLIMKLLRRCSIIVFDVFFWDKISKKKIFCFSGITRLCVCRCGHLSSGWFVRLVHNKRFERLYLYRMGYYSAKCASSDSVSDVERSRRSHFLCRYCHRIGYGRFRIVGKFCCIYRE